MRGKGIHYLFIKYLININVMQQILNLICFQVAVVVVCVDDVVVFVAVAVVVVVVNNKVTFFSNKIIIELQK